MFAGTACHSLENLFLRTRSRSYPRTSKVPCERKVPIRINSPNTKSFSVPRSRRNSRKLKGNISRIRLESVDEVNNTKLGTKQQPKEVSNKCTTSHQIWIKERQNFAVDKKFPCRYQGQNLSEDTNVGNFLQQLMNNASIVDRICLNEVYSQDNMMVVNIKEFAKVLDLAQKSSAAHLQSLETKVVQLTVLDDRQFPISLIVYPNGVGHAKGQFVSVFIQTSHQLDMQFLIVSFFIKSQSDHKDKNYQKSVILNGENSGNKIGIRQFIRHEEFFSYIRDDQSIMMGVKIESDNKCD